MSDFIVIPAYNEEKNITKVINKTKEFIQNIIVVDDGSKDHTSEQAKSCGVIVLKHKINLGKGAALKTGCDYAIQQGAERIIAMDSDGQHDPKEIPEFLAALENRDIVFGYRKRTQAMPFILKFGNGFINSTLQILYHIKIKDSQSGYRAFTAPAYQKIRWEASDYYLETEMITKASKHRLRYTQIPIETIYADRYKGTTVLDGVKIILKIVTARLLK